MKQLSIALGISTILGLFALLIVANPDITVSFIDTLKPICNALNIKTRAEAQSYIVMWTLVSFVGCFITMILAFKGKQLRRSRVRTARELKQNNSIVVNTKDDLKEIADEEKKKAKEEEKAEKEKVKKERKSIKTIFARKKKEAEETADEVADEVVAVEETVTETVEEVKEEATTTAKKTANTAKTKQQQLEEWLNNMKKK